MEILTGIGLVVLGAIIGMFAPAIFSANDEECPYQENCPKFQRYKFGYVKGKEYPERED